MKKVPRSPLTKLKFMKVLKRSPTSTKLTITILGKMKQLLLKKEVMAMMKMIRCLIGQLRKVIDNIKIIH